MKKAATPSTSECVTRTRGGAYALAALIYIVLAMTPSAIVYRAQEESVRNRQTTDKRRRGLDVITLSLNQTWEHAQISHNCAKLWATRHNYTIYTDDISHAYCDVCRCVYTKHSGCKCPEDGICHCEKLGFLQKRLQDLDEMVFLDADVMVLNEEVMDMVERRAEDMDFLAAYGYEGRSKYGGAFNSGVMFWRRLQVADPTLLTGLMWSMRQNNDQNIISRFVRQWYERWDVLSLRWHCRYLYKVGNEIDPGKCLLFHGRGRDLERFLEKTGIELLEVVGGEST